MQWLLISGFGLQGLSILVDEFYFHRRRGLPRWERIGHPLDTLSVLLTLGYLLLSAPTPTHLSVYIFLSLFSCLFVTKDEFIHQQRCGGGETWLHALLFICHPITFFGAGVIWFSHYRALSFPAGNGLLLWRALQAQWGLALFVFLYQLVYWNRPGGRTEG